MSTGIDELGLGVGDTFVLYDNTAFLIYEIQESICFLFAIIYAKKKKKSHLESIQGIYSQFLKLFLAPP